MADDSVRHADILTGGQTNGAGTCGAGDGRLLGLTEVMQRQRTW